MQKYSERELGQKMREARLKLGISIKKLSIKTKIATACLNEIEYGDRTPSLATLCRVLNALQCDANTLLRKEDL